MKYRALRFIDLYRPGDDIPEGQYDADMLAAMLARGQIEAVDEAPPVDVPSQEPAPRRIEKRPAKRQ